MNQREVRKVGVHVSVSFVSRPEIQRRYDTAFPCLVVPVGEMCVCVCVCFFIHVRTTSTNIGKKKKRD